MLVQGGLCAGCVAVSERAHYRGVVVAGYVVFTPVGGGG